MTLSTTIALSLLISYLIGSIPFGLILTKIFAKKDIRSHGSGNIGATNVLRSTNKKLGYITFLLDGSKGLISIYFVTLVLSVNSPMIIYYSGLCAIIGHIYPVWLKFKGGKGVATLIGVLFYHNIFFTISLLIGWYIIFYITRIVAISSIILMVAVIIFFIIQWKLVYTSIIIAAMLIILKHRDNIKRIIQGKENSF